MTRLYFVGANAFHMKSSGVKRTIEAAKICLNRSGFKRINSDLF